METDAQAMHALPYTKEKERKEEERLKGSKESSLRAASAIPEGRAPKKSRGFKKKSQGFKKIELAL